MMFVLVKEHTTKTYNDTEVLAWYMYIILLKDLHGTMELHKIAK